MTEHRVLVCGGRDYRDRRAVFTALDGLVPTPTHIITGDARGAVHHAMLWAVARSIPCTVFTAHWQTEGLAAGPNRNARMLVEGRPDLIVAFPGGRGTADMKRRARAAGVRILEVQ